MGHIWRYMMIDGVIGIYMVTNVPRKQRPRLDLLPRNVLRSVMYTVNYCNYRLQGVHGPWLASGYRS